MNYLFYKYISDFNCYTTNLPAAAVTDTTFIIVVKKSCNDTASSLVW